jgi:hypothetical protein
MASTRELWRESFLDDGIPALPCPWCDRGNLRYMDKTLRFEVPEADKIAERNGEFSPLDVRYRFILFLKCAVPNCGQVVSAHGDAEMHERDNWSRDEDRFCHALSPKGMHPAPPLATIPPETPRRVADELKVAFSLFWVDLGSCANRLRISVERILDEFDLPVGNLASRIQAFKKADPEHAATFDALRHVGNVGSHEGDVSRETILDAFEIYQDALAELYGKRTVRIDALKQKIIAAKGR